MTDSSSRESDTSRPTQELLNILDVRIKRISFHARDLRYFESYLAKYTEAIEFLVTTDHPLPIRDLSPVLYVGDVAVTEGTVIEENVYRFLAFELDQLEGGEAISLGWPGQPKEKRIETRFRYIPSN